MYHPFLPASLSGRTEKGVRKQTPTSLKSPISIIISIISELVEKEARTPQTGESCGCIFSHTKITEKLLINKVSTRTTYSLVWNTGKDSWLYLIIPKNGSRKSPLIAKHFTSFTFISLLFVIIKFFCGKEKEKKDTSQPQHFLNWPQLLLRTWVIYHEIIK